MNSTESISIDHTNSDHTGHGANVEPQRAHSHPPPNNNENRNHDYNGGKRGDAEDNPPPPRGWRYSKEKQNIINFLKDPLSEVHLMTKDQIWRKYASNYDQKKTNANLVYLLKQYQNNEGPFSSSSKSKSNTNTRVSNGKGDAKREVEPWKSRKKKSKGWDLLYKLRLHPNKSGISEMSQQEIWESSPLFKCYPFQAFQQYDRDMMKLVQKKRELIQQQREDYERDLADFPPSERTNRDEPFWNRHAAKKILEEDVKSGAANSMKPADLQNTRAEYQDFKSNTFAKHVYQEKSKQRAAPYWQVKCKKICQKLRKEQAEELERNWIQSRDAL